MYIYSGQLEEDENKKRTYRCPCREEHPWYLQQVPRHALTRGDKALRRA